jgi:hypothetical protein
MKDKRLQFIPFNLQEKRNEFYAYLSLLVWPFGVMIDSFFHWERPWTKNVFWLFCIFFGLTFVVRRDSLDAVDSVRIAQNLSNYAHSDMGFRDLWGSLYSEGTNNVDIIQPLLLFIVSRFTDNPIVLFTLYAIIFGYFSSRNLWFVLDHTKSKFTATLFIYFLAFFLTNPIWNINGFRMYAGMQVFLYGTLPFLFDRNRKRLIWAGVSILFHFSLAVPLVALLLYTFLKNRTSIYMAFFLLSAFIKELNLESVRSFLSFLPGVFQSRVEGYTSLGYAEGLRSIGESISWFVPLSEKCLTWVTYALTLFIFLFERPLLKKRDDLIRLFCFSLLLYGFANIASLVPSGGRFIGLANAFILVSFIIYISTIPENKSFSALSMLSLPLVVLYCIVNLRLGMDFFGLTTIIGNPIYAAFYPETVPIMDAIKGLF